MANEQNGANTQAPKTDVEKTEQNPATQAAANAPAQTAQQQQAPTAAATDPTQNSNKKTLIIVVSIVVAIVVLAGGFFAFSSFQKKAGHDAINQTIDTLAEIDYDKIDTVDIDDAESTDAANKEIDEQLAILGDAGQKLDEAQDSLNKAKSANFFLEDKDKKISEELQTYLNHLRDFVNADKDVLNKSKESVSVIRDTNEAIDSMQATSKAMSDVIDSFNSLSDPAAIGTVSEKIKVAREANTQTKACADKLANEHHLDVQALNTVIDNVNKACDAADAVCADVQAQAADRIDADIDNFNNIYQNAKFSSVANDLGDKVEEDFENKIKDSKNAGKEANKKLMESYEKLQDEHAKDYKNLAEMPH